MNNSLISGITLPQTQSILFPDRIRILIGALKSSVGIWNGRFSASQMSLDATARAIIINQEWYYLAKNSLVNDPGFRFVMDHGRRFFVFDDRLVIWHKLVNRQLLPSNIPTRRSLAWNQQQPLPGIPNCDRILFGYRMDLTGTVIKDAFCIFHVGKRIQWVWQLLGECIDTYPVQLPLHHPNALHQASPHAIFDFSDYS